MAKSTMPRGVLACVEGVWVKGVVKASEIPADAMAALAVHGAYQVCTDATAGKPDSERTAIFAEMWTRIKDEGWPFARASGGTSTAIVVEAIARAKGVTVEKAQAAYDRLSDEAKKALPKALAVQIAEIRLERAKKAEVDANEVLDGLEV